MASPERSATLPGTSNKLPDIVNWAPFRDRALVALSILTMCTLAWAYLIYLVSETPPMASETASMSMVMPADHAWELLDFAAMFVMWSVMMVAMMLPSATPMILLFEQINRKRKSQGKT
jgi:predicted metal-binding membrane protein